MRRSWVMLAVVAALVAACSGSATTGAPQATGTPAGATQAGATPIATGATDTASAVAPTALDACSLITTSEASAALGEPVDPGAAPEPGAPSCAFAGHPAQGADLNYVEISITSAADFDPTQSSIPGLAITPVSGVGDSAYYVSRGPGTVALNVRKGQTTFTTSVTLAGASDTRLQAVERTLALLVLGRI